MPQWRRIADHAARILVPTEEARKFAERFVPHQTIKKLEPPSFKRIERPSDDGLGIRLGMVPIRMCAQEQMLIHHLAASLKQARLRRLSYGPWGTVERFQCDAVRYFRDRSRRCLGARSRDPFLSPAIPIHRPRKAPIWPPPAVRHLQFSGTGRLHRLVDGRHQRSQIGFGH